MSIYKKVEEPKHDPPASHSLQKEKFDVMPVTNVDMKEMDNYGPVLNS